MLLNGLLPLLTSHPAFTDVVNRLRQDGAVSASTIRSARPYAIAALASVWQGPVIVLTPHIKRAYNIVEQLPVWLPESRHILRYNEPTPQFYERAAWGDEVVRERIAALAALMEDDATPIIVSSARALMQRTMPPNRFRRSTERLVPGDRHTIDGLLARWVALGYDATPIVIEPGTFSRRGGVIDVYPIAASHPVRIDFFGDEIDTLRAFDPSTQLSTDHLDSVTITPAREVLPSETPPLARHLADWFGSLPDAEDDMTAPGGDAEPLGMGVPFPYLEHYLPYLYENPISLLDYAPDNALILVEDWDDLAETVAEIDDRAQKARADSTMLAPDHPAPYVAWGDLADSLGEHRLLRLGHGADDPLSGVFTPGGRFGGQVRPMLTQLRDQRQQGHSLIVITEQAERLKQVWYEQDASEFIPTATTVESAPAPGSLTFMTGTMQEGWGFKHESGHLHLLTDAEIFGWTRPEPRRRKSARRGRTPEADYADWRVGDYVVHVDYGIGQFGGLTHRTVEDNEREYLLVRYAENSMIYVPIHQADRLTKYIGADDTPPGLSRLGKPDWQRVKKRTRKAIEEDASELIQLYAARTKVQGHVFSPDSHWQHELEASFPYVETEDQLRSLREVKADMESAQPMDRLICGDVGYGKTEIALRAAFKAITDGKQVALLVPTTVLAQQHFDTFSNRLAPFPIRVEMMSRFRTREQQSRLLPEIASGTVDIVIGTHRILSNDITFKDLGLVIIDEEQRFGVKHKEHFKKLRTRIDVLTLTATPIPRTLYMGLTGVRDISMIQTPPEERLPVITHVGRFDEHLIRGAILRELERGGQVFIVHNRVRTIETLREQIEDIVPEARIVIGHGQMGERELERVMVAFAHGEYDILLSTSIIESGIDIPNANTLVVDRADRMGLAQLYQLRGRVGRSAQQGYAYFFHPRRQTEESRARLETLAENTSLGSGFNVAMRDLELRGAGDILSTRQTGQISAIGLHLYTQLLTQAVKRMKGELPQEEEAQEDAKGIVIDLPLPAYIPKDWIHEMALRLQIYRRIGGLTDRDRIEAMRSELMDRFGQLPQAVENLLYQIEVKVLAQAINATHVLAQRGRVQIKLPYLGEVNRGALEQSLGDHVEVSRVAVAFPMDDDDLWRLRLLDILEAIRQGVHAAIQEATGR
jgi:transcription-repair coupling factor (superfamily II helicase)